MLRARFVTDSLRGQAPTALAPAEWHHHVVINIIDPSVLEHESGEHAEHSIDKVIFRHDLISKCQVIQVHAGKVATIRFVEWNAGDVAALEVVSSISHCLFSNKMKHAVLVFQKAWLDVVELPSRKTHDVQNFMEK